MLVLEIPSHTTIDIFARYCHGSSPGSFHFETEIEEDSTGYDYYQIFFKCIDDKLTKVKVWDPYIRNFDDFCSTLMKYGKNLKKVNLVTSAARDRITAKKQRKSLKSLSKKFRKKGLEIVIKYQHFHYRKFRFDNGWKVIIDRGLDIYKQVDYRSSEYYSPELRPCRETNVDYIYKK
uniref:MITD1 C-terminal phospholipase D-like domain-containing protein n=1 Tax=Acrobeloides nanus TaxID=290746 RepID=A0A914C1L0_9BILA